MVSFVFSFRINNSFLSYSNHPITIPKYQVDYKKLDTEGLVGDNFIVIFPKGEYLEGYIYYGTSGWGDYCQLKFSAKQIIPQYIDIVGKEIFIILFKHRNQKYAILEYKLDK